MRGSCANPDGRDQGRAIRGLYVPQNTKPGHAFAGLLMVAAAAVPVRAAAPGLPAPAAPEITAPIALMVDVGSGRVLFSREARRRFIPASLTKIMTSHVAFELLAQGKLSLDQRFTVRNDTFRKWRGVGSTMFLNEGQQVSVAELLEGIVTVSANDACVVLAEGVAGSVPAFTAMMNAEARRLGMRDSHYNTPNGWPDEGQTYVSAADLATLSTAMITRHPDLYRRFYGHARMSWNGIDQPNHNPLYGTTPGADGVKTGFTNEAGYGFVGSAERNGRRLMMVVGGFDRPNERARQSRAFIEWGFNAWQAMPLFAGGDRVAEALVQGGAAHTVGLVAPRALFATSPKGAVPKVELAVRYKGPLRAPIAKGETVATLVVRTAGEPPRELPLVAAEAVARGSAADRLRDGLMELVGL